MRTTLKFITALAFCLIIALPISAAAQGRPFRQTHTIEIEVECLDTAVDAIRGLNGHNLEFSQFQEHTRHGIIRRANYSRRVDVAAFRVVQAELRALGEVLHESEHARFLGAEIMDVEARLTAIEQERERLSVMMAISESLDEIIVIDTRLSQLDRERNQLMGLRNVLFSQAEHPVITIRLREMPEDIPAPPPDTFGGRVADRFMRSWRGTVRAGGNFMVFMAGALLPLIIWGTILGAAGFVFIRVRKRLKTEGFVGSAPISKEDGS